MAMQHSKAGLEKRKASLIVTRISIFLGRGNRIGQDGWNAVLDRLSSCTQISILNSCRNFPLLVAGECEELDLSGYEMGSAVTRFLSRSSINLKTLDLR
jgi:hypothetical protein